MTTEEKIDQIIEVLQAHKEGKTIQVKDSNGWNDLKSKGFYPVFIFNLNEYRIKPEKTSIPATEEELRQVKIKWYKTKDSGILFCNAHESSCLSYPEDISPDDYFLLNPETKCWEDWSEE